MGDHFVNLSYRRICNTYQLSAESKLYQALLMIINHYNYSDVQKEDNNKIINILLSFSIQTNVPQANKSKNCTLINIDAITGFHYPQFIPLILCFIQTIPYTSKSFNTISIVYKALYEEISQKDTSFQHINQVLPHWYFWIFLLMTHESQNNMARWKKLIGSILIQNQQDFQDFVSSLTIYCSLTKQIFIILFSEIMNYFFEEINVLETKELTNIRKSLISGTIIFNTCQIILLQPTVLLDLQNNLSYLIIDYIKSINSAITNIQYLKNLDFSCLTSSDGKWKVTRLLMFVIFYITNHTSLLSFMGDSETVIGYYIPILLEKIMPTDYELYSSHLTSILKESNTDSTFIRMVHLQAISVFHNHKNLIPILFKIVKEKNIEVSNLSNDEILSNADLINLTVNETVSRSIKTFTKQFEDKTKKVAESFGIIETLKPYSPHLYIIENRDFMISGYQRKKHYDSKLWEDTLDEMKHDVTSIWNLPNISTHRKYSQYFNLHGEHIHTKRNKNFDNHLSASLARDESIEVPQQASFHDFEQVETKIKDSIAFFEIDCRLLTLSSLFIGKLFIDNMMSLIFEGKKICDPITGDTKDAQKFVTIKLSEIRYILWRRFRHIDNSIEIMGSRSHFFTFQDANERLRFLNELEKLQKTKINDSHNAQANVFINMYIQMKPSIEAFLSLNFTGRWKSGKMTNYEYLFWVNMFAGRSYCDLSQYPVYPWILCDYSSNVLDLNNPNSFRDLSLPIGCLNKKRFEELKILKQELVGSDMYCLYRLHYSAAAYVIFYLLRCEPFTSLHINLQNNRFDDPNRLFKSVEETWGHVTSNNYDFRELIPEFFTFPEFLLNNDNFDLGVTSETHEQVNHVNMPPWASSASHFIALHKLALESPYVSSNIDKWIDLIFGYLQNGSQSEAANNDFHPWSYSSSINNLTSSIEHIQMHAANFGITPEQLFKEKHPTRDIKLAKQISTSKSISLDIDHYQAINGDNVVLMKNTGQKYLLTIDTKGRIVQYKLDGNINNSHSVLNRKSMLTKDDTNNFESTTVFEKHYALMPCLGLSLISAPWMDKFSLFQMKKTTGSFSFKGEEKLKNIFISPKHSACISIIRTNSNYIATGTHDAAVKLFKIKINDRNDVDETTAEYRLFIGHSASIVDIAMSKCLDTIISIDESGLLLMYNISKERLIYSMILKQTPKRVFLSKLGFFILVTEIVGEESLMTTQIRLFDFSGRLHKYFEYSTGFICGDICTMQDSSEFFIATFTNKCLIMFRAYDLADVCKYTMLSEILTFSFDKYDMTIFLKLANHEVYKATINCE
ncbi:hypothetical protein TRFO_42682 [Tritrichomonas foetus]|uniref:Beige/BEACH domain containing protein n=1 Tax=Tritrichomonas foetus TaxID=1144522 RepID=A0A1J4KV09_9EUKA|nr:hypothetical protein TRFO_42682 [Tritrichomonas foetus]|eukprot:OHT15145.1 hypothetical protein TRFO_42682 [Tritrichomonas foetus]